MPECANCGSHVTRDYIRVRSIDGETVHACPRCPDRVHRDGRPRNARSSKIFSEDGNEGGNWSW